MLIFIIILPSARCSKASPPPHTEAPLLPRVVLCSFSASPWRDGVHEERATTATVRYCNLSPVAPPRRGHTITVHYSTLISKPPHPLHYNHTATRKDPNQRRQTPAAETTAQCLATKGQGGTRHRLNTCVVLRRLEAATPGFS